jgi:hypothetical protein
MQRYPGWGRAIGAKPRETKFQSRGQTCPFSARLGGSPRASQVFFVPRYGNPVLTPLHPVSLRWGMSVGAFNFDGAVHLRDVPVVLLQGDSHYPGSLRMRRRSS